MQKKILSNSIFRFSFTVLMMIAGLGCQKKNAGILTTAMPNSEFTNPLVEKAFHLLKSNSKSYEYLQMLEPRWGQLDWSRALPARNPDELVCLVPYIAEGMQEINALAIISLSDSVKIKLVPA